MKSEGKSLSGPILASLELKKKFFFKLNSVGFAWWFSESPWSLVGYSAWGHKEPDMTE